MPIAASHGFARECGRADATTVDPPSELPLPWGALVEPVDADMPCSREAKRLKGGSHHAARSPRAQRPRDHTHLARDEPPGSDGARAANTRAQPHRCAKRSARAPPRTDANWSVALVSSVPRGSRAADVRHCRPTPRADHRPAAQSVARPSQCPTAVPQRRPSGLTPPMSLAAPNARAPRAHRATDARAPPCDERAVPSVPSTFAGISRCSMTPPARAPAPSASKSRTDQAYRWGPPRSRMRGRCIRPRIQETPARSRAEMRPL